MWIPCSPLARKAGVKDSLDAAKTYLRCQAGEHFNDQLIDNYLRRGPEAVDFFISRTRLQFELGLTMSDYHPNDPGGLPGGRGMVAAPYDGRELGKEIGRLRPPIPEMTLFGMMVGSGGELKHFFNALRSVKSAFIVSALLMRYARDRILHGRAMRLTNGNALVGRLAKSLFDNGAPIWTRAPAKALIMERGAVKGAIVEHAGKRIKVAAARGVVLATGGFPQNVELRKRFFSHAPTGKEHWSLAPDENTGDGLMLGEGAGGSLLTDLPNAAAWAPVSLVRRKNGEYGAFPHGLDRGKPGVIAVTRRGQRFTNEGDSYHDFVQAMIRSCEGKSEICAFLIADHRTLRRYGLGNVKPFPLSLKPHLRSGYLLRGETPAKLAEVAGIDKNAFVETLERFNRFSRRGEDPEFHRGETAYNRYVGDPDHKPNPAIGPVEEGPFYAVKLLPGDLGTYAGLKVNENAQVLDSAGVAVPGLFASGNDAASMMGGSYPGGGVVLGPALVNGYLAGRYLAEQQAPSI